MLAFCRPAISAFASLASFGGVVLCGTLVLQQAPVQAQFLPVYTTTGAVGGTTPTNPSSFGFFFEAASNVQVDGLGFSSQAGWGNSTSYTVKLWSYVNSGASPSDYTELAMATFTQGNPYTFQDGFFWQSLSPVISLPESIVSDPTDQVGYVIAAIGDFSGVNGNVQFEGGTATFNPNIVNQGDGFNDVTDMNGFFEIPVYPGSTGLNGYYNANLSLVPGPLPVLGAAAGFSWTRRLRKRIRGSK
jgi:hypothetical protein